MNNEKKWRIICSNYEGPQKHAVDIVYAGLGKYVLSDKGIYSFHTLDCGLTLDCNNENTVIIGTFNENPLFGKYINPSEIAKGGYVVKVLDNPENTDYKIVLICGYSQRETLYGAIDFTDDYFAAATPSVDAFIHLDNELFEHKLPNYTSIKAPSFDTRSIFTWGHVIGNMNKYFMNMARLKLNQIIIWNDYMPLNAAEIVETAHSYGIEVIWGFAWGWRFDCSATDISDLETLKEEIISTYKSTYKGVGDGIYFQSFTELPVSEINGISISEAVTELVNSTAGELLKEEPDLHIQFGLHTTSVREHLYDIAKVDKRIEIVFEDCGGFPYKATPDKICDFKNETEFAEQYDFADKIINLRKKINTGIVYKCMLTMDWSRNRVTHQPGPYVLGHQTEEVRNDTLNLIQPIWRFYTAEWLEYGKYAYNLTKHIRETSGGHCNMCLAGTFTGGIWYPTALCAEMFFDTKSNFEELQKRVARRHWVRF